MCEVWKNRQCYLFIAPLLIFYTLINLGATSLSFGLSLSRWRPGASPKWLGWDNYARLFRDEIFWIAIRNTFAYAAMVIALGIPLALSLALLLDSGIRGRGFFVVAYYLPVVTASVVVVVMWRWLLSPSYGIVNNLMEQVGLKGQNWFGSEHLALPTVAAMGIWQTVGYNMVLFLAGLQNIPSELYEAARVDGAGTWRRFWSITLPLLRPTMLFVLVLGTISAFQVFEQVQLLPNPGGPLRATTTATFFIYQQAFDFFKMGYASAAAFVLGLIIIGFSLVQQRVVGMEDIY